MPVPRLRGLICDDDPDVQRAVAVIMGRCGFEPLVGAGFGAELVAAVERARPDTMVLELTLTGEAGLTLIPAIHRAAPGVKIVAISHFTALHDEVVRAGAVDLIDKADLRPLELCLQTAGTKHPVGCACCRRVRWPTRRRRM